MGGNILENDDLGQKKGAMMEIKARINPISYEKPYYKRRI